MFVAFLFGVSRRSGAGGELWGRGHFGSRSNNSMEEPKLRKMIAGAVTALLLAGGGAFAASAAPDPNGPAQKGLCTAYFNGSERGQEEKRKAGPFVALEAAADEANGDGDGVGTEDEVAAFCGELVGGRAGGDKGTPGKP